MLNSTKICSACKSDLPLASFNKDKSKRDGKCSRCRECNKARSAQWYIDNKETALEQRKERFQRKRDIEIQQMREWRRANPERKKASDDAWRVANIDRVKRNALDWSRRNRDSVYARTAAYKRANPQRVMEWSHRRRASQWGSGSFPVSDRELTRLKSRHDGCCAYCGSSENMTIDHVVPLSRGGTHSIGNLLPACGFCNFSKGAKLLTEWRAWKMVNPIAS